MLPAVARFLGRLPQGTVWVLAALWAALIWWLLGGSGVAPKPWFWLMGYAYDLSHAALFGGQAVWLALAWRAAPLDSTEAAPAGLPAAVPAAEQQPSLFGARSSAWLLAGAVALAYGGLMEWRQAALPDRHASWFDLATDAVGAFGLPWILARPERSMRRAALVLLSACLTAAAARGL